MNVIRSVRGLNGNIVCVILIKDGGKDGTEGGRMTREEINNMNHKQFVGFLKRYADARDGELSYIADSASHRINVLNNRVDELEQEPKTGHCRECKYFEYDSVAKVNGIPLIVAHEICSRWGDGCKTTEDGYCFLYEPKMSEIPTD